MGRGGSRYQNSRQISESIKVKNYLDKPGKVMSNLTCNENN